MPTMSKKMEKYHKLLAFLASDALVWCGVDKFSARDPELYKWFGAVLRSDFPTSEFGLISHTVKELGIEGNLAPELRYQIGKMFKEVNPKTYPKFKCNETEAEFVEFYDTQNEKAKQAVISWDLCARRGNLVHKDIVRVIGKCVWDLRCDADYVLEVSEN